MSPATVFKLTFLGKVEGGKRSISFQFFRGFQNPRELESLMDVPVLIEIAVYFFKLLHSA